MRNGKVRNVLVPGGRSLWGWKKMAECLDNLADKRFWKRGTDRTVANEFRPVNIPTVKDKQDSNAIKDWKMAITIYRTNTRMSWGDISRKLESITKRKSEVFQVAADRAIFWCREKQELEGLLLKPDQLSSYKTYVCLWSALVFSFVFTKNTFAVLLKKRNIYVFI